VALAVQDLVVVGLAPGDFILILVAMQDSQVDLIRMTSSVNSLVVVVAKAQLDLVWAAWEAAWEAVKTLDL
jgi:hypothetical protein